MKPKFFFTLSLAAASLALIAPGAINAQGATSNDTAMQNSAMQSGTATQAATREVPAVAKLKTTLDAKNLQPGSGFNAVLVQSVKLKDGTELPKGTTLVGKVERNTAHPTDQSKSNLTLRFTEAHLKGGNNIPIHATIMAVAPPTSILGNPQNAMPVQPWDGRTVQVDQHSSIPGLSLRSRIVSKNSGTLISTKKVVKLDSGSQLALAIGPPSSAEEPAS